MAGFRSGIAKYTQHTFEELVKTGDNPTSPKAKFGGSFVRSSTLRTEKRGELKAYLSVPPYESPTHLPESSPLYFFCFEGRVCGGEGGTGRYELPVPVW